MAEGRGLEPRWAFARQFSRLLPYQLGLALRGIRYDPAIPGANRGALPGAGQAYPTDGVVPEAPIPQGN